jgi:hypothetical protein
MLSERRSSARIQAKYPARLRGPDTERKPFKEDTVLQNLSNGGAYLYSKREVPEGAGVFLAVRLSLAPHVGLGSPALMLAARGRVTRVEPKPDGRRGLAIEFERRRVL